MPPFIQKLQSHKLHFHPDILCTALHWLQVEHRTYFELILNISYSISQEICTRFLLCFAVLCCGYTLTDFPISIRLTSLALWQSNDCPSASKATLMNMDKYFMWIHYERLHNHNKAKHNKTVCIFLGIYCIFSSWVSYRMSTVSILQQTDHVIKGKCIAIPDSKVHEAYMGPTWGRQDPGGPHVCPMNLAIGDVVCFIIKTSNNQKQVSSHCQF